MEVFPESPAADNEIDDVDLDEQLDEQQLIELGYVPEDPNKRARVRSPTPTESREVPAIQLPEQASSSSSVSAPNVSIVDDEDSSEEESGEMHVQRPPEIQDVTASMPTES